jgi:uncharacterized damage-inducible protein DinB
MEQATERDLRYPVGRHEPVAAPTPEQRDAFMRDIEEMPAKMRAAVEGLSDAQLDTEYRPGGWTVRQVAHHVPDSHMNSYVRFKLGLTEDAPTIKTYEEGKWAELADARGPVEPSLALLDVLHERWAFLLRSLTDEQWAREIQHPELGRMTLGSLLALYAWHSRHHVAHVTALRDRMRW